MRHVQKTDTEIQQDVIRELSWDTRLVPAEVGVVVKQGVVTLSGTVDSWAKLRAAAEVAHRVCGVLDVANDLTVTLPSDALKTDAEIARVVRHAIEWDTLVPHEMIRTTVSHGHVTLDGQVPYWSQRFDAEHAIERLTGVKRVINRIEVAPIDNVDVTATKKAVEKALERHAEREAGRIDIRAVGGQLNVTGTVHSWQEKEAVLGAVRGTRGVKSVTDHLRIQSPCSAATGGCPPP